MAMRRSRRTATIAPTTRAAWNPIQFAVLVLNYIVPDYVHVLYDGRIVKSGDKQLAVELEAKGYDWIIKAA